MKVYVVYCSNDNGFPVVYGVYRTEKQAEAAKELIFDRFPVVKVELFYVR
jgi:hypothetical protein